MLNEVIKVENKIKGGLYGFCIGDALGAPVEFMSKTWIKKRYGYISDYKSGFFTIPYFLKRAGTGTDDTQFMHALSNGLLKNPSDPYQSISHEFNKLRLFPLFIGKTLLYDFFFYFGNWNATARFVNGLLRGRTAGNGALMRTLPISFMYKSLEEIEEKSVLHARMTHWNDLSNECCIVYNKIAFYLLQGKSIQEAISLSVEGTCVEDYSIEGTIPNGYCVYSLIWTIHWLLHTNSFEEAVLAAINEGGDSDTIAALVGGLAGIYYGYESIPERFLQGLKRKKKVEQLAKGFLQNIQKNT